MVKNKDGYNQKLRIKNIRKNRLNEPVNDEFEPTIKHYETYLQEESLNEGKFFDLFKEFESKQVTLKDVKFGEYIKSLINNNALVNNRKLYTHIRDTLDYFVSNNLLHIDTRNHVKNILNNVLYSANKEYQTRDFKSKYIKVDYTKYRKNDDFRVVYSNQLLNELYSKGGEIYLSNKNKILLKLSKNDELKEYNKKTAEVILTSKFKFKVKIIDELLSNDDIIFK